MNKMDFNVNAYQRKFYGKPEMKRLEELWKSKTAVIKKLAMALKSNWEQRRIPLDMEFEIWFEFITLPQAIIILASPVQAYIILKNETDKLFSCEKDDIVQAQSFLRQRFNYELSDKTPFGLGPHNLKGFLISESVISFLDILQPLNKIKDGGLLKPVTLLLKARLLLELGFFESASKKGISSAIDFGKVLEILIGGDSYTMRCIASNALQEKASMKQAYNLLKPAIKKKLEELLKEKDLRLNNS